MPPSACAWASASVMSSAIWSPRSACLDCVVEPIKVRVEQRERPVDREAHLLLLVVIVGLYDQARRVIREVRDGDRVARPHLPARLLVAGAVADVAADRDRPRRPGHVAVRERGLP